MVNSDRPEFEGRDSVSRASIGGVLDAAALEWGDRPALVFDPGESVTFNALQAATNEMAQYLVGLVVAKGDRVTVMLGNRWEFPVAWLAVARIGAVMAPINVRFTMRETGYLLEHSQPKVVITENAVHEVLAQALATTSTTAMVVIVEQGQWRRHCESSTAANHPAQHVSVDTPVNIQYTSGTTGRPKGCVLTHGYWLRLASKFVDGFPRIQATDRLLTAQPFYYLDPQWNLMVSLMSGATLVVLDGFHPSSFWNKVREHQVTAFYCLGAMPTLMMKVLPDARDREHRVRTILCSGIPPAMHESLEHRWGVPWFELFGMTETGADILMPEADQVRLVGSGCIGKVLTDREARVVDELGMEVGPGQQGQLLLRGPWMMEGYYKDPDATGTAFSQDWLHTGDIVRMDDAGFITHMGREKDIIRRSGENIAAAEVEGVLQSHPMVRIAACVARPDEIRGEEVAAFVVLQHDESDLAAVLDQLHEFCAANLAPFKVPRYWTFCADLPRTPSERVAKSFLKAQQSLEGVVTFDRNERTQ